MYRQNFQQKMRELGITAEDAVSRRRATPTHGGTPCDFLLDSRTSSAACCRRWIGGRERRNPERRLRGGDPGARRRSTARSARPPPACSTCASKLERELRSVASELARVAAPARRRGRARRRRRRRSRSSAGATRSTRDVERLTAELARAHRRGRTRRSGTWSPSRTRSTGCATRRCACSPGSPTPRRACASRRRSRGLSPDADIQALEEVREHINRLVDRGEAQSARRPIPSSSGGSATSATPRRTRAARAQLDELKRAKRASLVPMTLTPAVAPAPASRTPAPAAR